MQKVIKRFIVAEAGRGGDPLDWYCERVVDGYTANQIADYLSEKSQWPITRHGVRRWLDATYGAAAVDAAFVIAHRKAAGTLVEDAQELVDKANPDPETGQVNKAKEQARIRLWRAERGNPEVYGQAKGNTVNVNLSLGQLHLDALRARATVIHALPAAEPSQEVEAAIVAEEVET